MRWPAIGFVSGNGILTCLILHRASLSSVPVGAVTHAHHLLPVLSSISVASSDEFGAMPGEVTPHGAFFENFRPDRAARLDQFVEVRRRSAIYPRAGS